MKTLLKTQMLPRTLLVILAFAMAFSYSCTSNPSASDSDGNAAPKNPDGMILIRGTVIQVSLKQIAIKTDDSTQTVMLADSLQLYARSASSLAAVTNTSFIGVTTQKQADGSDQATEIHLFPEELRGLGEGSFMMDAQAMDTGSRMTNGEASRMTNGEASRMTNGEASRMTNGEVQKAGGFSLVIQYQGKSRTVKVPDNTPVTAYTVTDKKLSPGVNVVALAKKDASGNFTTSKILISDK
jgi:hypothetical protein